MRTFNLVNINAKKGDKVVVLADMYQVMPWPGAMPLVSVIEDRAYLGFVPSGTYTVAVTPESDREGCAKVYEIAGPL